MKIIIFTTFFIAILSLQTYSQTPSPTPPDYDNDIVKISTTLIQIDATVTDKNGKAIPDLTVDDFEVFENDKKQDITNLSFITVQLPSKPKTKSVVKSTDPIPPPPVPIKLKPGEVRRTLALVVDNLGLSFGNVFFVRSALKKFVDKQMEDGDLVAIITTSGGMGALQQFTSDKRILYAAIDKIKFNIRGDIASFSPIVPTMKEELNATMNAATGETTENVPDGVTPGPVLGTKEDQTFDIGTVGFREDVFAVGTLGAVNFVINAMKQLPGRKAMTLFSEGFNQMQAASLNPNSTQMTVNPRLEGAFKKIIDSANRSGVIIYAVDPRGLVNPGFNADDYRVGLRDNSLVSDQAIRDRETELSNTQNSLKYITEETGGFAVINNNDINDGIERMLEDQQGYYLIGYEPNEETFDPEKRRFNKLSVKVKRPGAKIRYRSGFFAVSDSKKSATENPQQNMIDVLASPFASGQIRLNLTTLYANDTKDGNFVRSLVHINGNDLNFKEQKDGWQQASFEILAATFGENGVVENMTNRTEFIRARAAALQEIKNRGLVYSMVVPIEKPGPYQMRVALRDMNNSNVGSANQFIDIPNLKKNNLAISGLLLESTESSVEKNRREKTSIVQSELQRDRAIRSFPQGTEIKFGAAVYNISGRIAKQANFYSQFRIYREGQEIFSSNEDLLSLGNQIDSKTVNIAGAFGLGKAMPTGDYVLQVIVKDSTGKKPQYATQWIDFTVVK